MAHLSASQFKAEVAAADQLAEQSIASVNEVIGEEGALRRGEDIPPADTELQAADLELLELLFPVALNNTFSYLAPSSEKMQAVLGALVIANFRNKEQLAIVKGRRTISAAELENLSYKVKAIKEIVPCAPLSENLLDFINKVANYNMVELGVVAKMVIAAAWNKKAKNPLKVLKSQVEIEFNPQEVGKIGEVGEIKDISLNSRISSAIIDLSPAQDEVFVKIASEMQNYTVFLLEGVTGSGKTEVYLKIALEAMAHQDLERGRGQVLVLLPEIFLSTQLAERFRKTLQLDVVIWHSEVSPSKKRQIWRDVQAGRIQFIAGARSALFLPFRNLRCIIVDEEHDSSFKQEEGAVYHARDMAVLRANIENIPILLASATPSIESIYNARMGKYKHFRINQRYSGVELPEVVVSYQERQVKGNKERKAFDHKAAKQASPSPSASADKQSEQPNNAQKPRWLHQLSIEELQRTLDAGRQALLFLNRRGYAPILLCLDCGYKVECPNCKFYLTYHKKRNVMQCHYCGYSAAYTTKCRECNSGKPLISCGPGIEKVHEELAQAFPQARIMLLSSDTIATPSKAQAALKAITQGEVDFIIGTQIIAKGVHFGNLHLVVVMDASTSHLGPDIRALEKTQQLIYQVMGRAGREAVRGKIVLQTDDPQSPILEHLCHYDADAFATMELGNRKLADMPPYSRLVALTASSSDEIALLNWMRALMQAQPMLPDTIVPGRDWMLLGPAPAPVYKINGKFRYKIIIKASKKLKAQHIVSKWLEDAPVLPRNVSLKIDVDPYNFA